MSKRRNKNNVENEVQENIVDITSEEFTEVENTVINDEYSEKVNGDIYLTDYLDSCKTRLKRDHPVAVRRAKKVIKGAAAVAGTVIASLVTATIVRLVTGTKFTGEDDVIDTNDDEQIFPENVNDDNEVFEVDEFTEIKDNEVFEESEE
jgi:hypothetical protein